MRERCHSRGEVADVFLRLADVTAKLTDGHLETRVTGPSLFL